MRNDHILFKNDAIALVKGLRNKKEKIENAKLSNIETSLNIVIHYYDSTL